MAKNERVKIYNKGKRDWDFIDPVEGRVWCHPGKSIEVDKSVADKYIAAYPQEFVLGDSVASTGRGSEKALKKQIDEMAEALTDCNAEIERRGAVIEELQKENEELKAKIEELEKDAEKQPDPKDEGKGKLEDSKTPAADGEGETPASKGEGKGK